MAASVPPQHLSDSQDEELIDAIWKGLRPYAIKLREIIMQNPQPSNTPGDVVDSTPNVNTPSFATRRAACTHLQMEKLYGFYLCDICRRVSQLGWVYSCIQDDDHTAAECVAGIMNEPDSTPEGGANDENSSEGEDLTLEGNGQGRVVSFNSWDFDQQLQGHAREVRMPTADLSSWVEKAIKEGHYTPDQITTMRAQKQHVVDTAWSAVTRFEEMQTNIHNIARTSTLQSVDANPHLPFPIINEVQETPFSVDQASAEKPKLKMFPYCKFRACQACRPTYRDRAWRVLDDVFAKQISTSPADIVLDTRPLASASLLRKIGIREQPRRSRPRLRSFDSRQLYYSKSQNSYPNLARELSTIRRSSCDIADMRIEPESRGFRESMKRALKGMLMASTRNSSRSRSGRKRNADEVDTDDFDMALFTDLNEELLEAASGVALPGHDGLDGLGDEVGEVDEVDVSDGVAVTEEAVGLGAADIIMTV